MDKIKLYDKTFKIYLKNEKIEARIKEVANQINQDYTDKDCPIFLGVLNGSFMFAASLIKNINILSEILFVKLASYEGTQSTGTVKQLIGINEDLTGRKIIIVEDIVDTGGTIEKLDQILKEKGASEVKVCTLFYKPASYSKNIPIDYRAFEIPNDFIVGFGLDYDHLGRQYKDIYIIDENENQTK
ncbi:MAG: hypoxanthine phosphoribosyltransferase [Bacteroidales bacterium]